MSKRQYRQTQRAEQQEETRDRIVRATMELHGELGPRNTTIKAIAERAGVQRLTVYRHFDNEDSLFLACSGLWLELNPPPQPEAWSHLRDRRERIITALTLFYRYYSATRQMWHGVYRDLDEVPSLRVAMAGFGEFMAGIYASVLGTEEADIASPLRQSLAHGLRFSTWESLEQEQLDDAAKVQLVLHWLAAWL